MDTPVKPSPIAKPETETKAPDKCPICGSQLELDRDGRRRALFFIHQQPKLTEWEKS